MTNRNLGWLIYASYMCSSIFLYGQTTKEPADTIITGMVVTMDGQRHIYDDGAVAVTAAPLYRSNCSPMSSTCCPGRHG